MARMSTHDAEDPRKQEVAASSSDANPIDHEAEPQPDLLGGVVEPQGEEKRSAVEVPASEATRDQVPASGRARGRDRWGPYRRWSAVKFNLQNDASSWRSRDPEEND